MCISKVNLITNKKIYWSVIINQSNLTIIILYNNNYYSWNKFIGMSVQFVYNIMHKIFLSDLNIFFH